MIAFDGPSTNQGQLSIDHLKATAGATRVAVCSRHRPRAPLFLPDIMSVRHSGYFRPQSLPPFAVAFSNSSLDRLSSHPISLPPPSNHGPSLSDHALSLSPLKQPQWSIGRKDPTLMPPSIMTVRSIAGTFSWFSAL